MIDRIIMFFFPYIERKAKNKDKKNLKILNEINLIKIDDINITVSEDIDTAINLALNNYNDEGDRLNSTFSKSAVFIEILAIIIFIAQYDFHQVEHIVDLIVIILLILAVVYSIITFVLHYKIYKRDTFFRVGINDILKTEKGIDYRKRILCDLLNSIKLNSNIINKKVTYMALSQEYFLRSTLCIFLIVILILLSNIVQPNNLSFLKNELLSFINLIEDFIKLDIKTIILISIITTILVQIFNLVIRGVKNLITFIN